MISEFYLILLAIPILLLGEEVVRKIKILTYFNIPAPVVGGLIVSLLSLLVNISSTNRLFFSTHMNFPLWTWVIVIEPEWIYLPFKDVQLPFMVAFFTCIGLNASWNLVRRGSYLVVSFWSIALLLAVLQNVVGVMVSILIGEIPLFGLMFGSAAMTGGHGTALGFSVLFEEYGLIGAGKMGMTAATFGLIAGGLIGGPIGTLLIRQYKLKTKIKKSLESKKAKPVSSGIIQDLNLLLKNRLPVLKHLILVIFLMKCGAWLSYYFHSIGLNIPLYVGSMVLGVFVRNLIDKLGYRWIDSVIVELISSVMLALFLVISLTSINLLDIEGSVYSIFIIIFSQITLAGIFAYYVCPKAIGRNYEAAIIAAGLCGFSLGATPNAIANMKGLVGYYGTAPRAFLVISLVGAFLIDVSNTINLIVFFNLLT